MFFIIYKTTNKINGKIYVGQHKTKNINDGYIGSGLILNNARQKYGEENFKREILEFCTRDNLNEREIYWIEKLCARNPHIGYNIKKGGSGGDVFTGNPNMHAIREKISKGVMKRFEGTTKYRELLSKNSTGLQNPNSKHIYRIENLSTQEIFDNVTNLRLFAKEKNLALTSLKWAFKTGKFHKDIWKVTAKTKNLHTS